MFRPSLLSIWPARPLEPDPNGTDSEGLVALEDGGFWVGDEYGPSLLRVDAEVG
jgi:hypothetical protein